MLGIPEYKPTGISRYFPKPAAFGEGGIFTGDSCPKEENDKKRMLKNMIKITDRLMVLHLKD